MKASLPPRLAPYLPLLRANLGCLAGGLLGAAGGLYLAAMGALLGFMIDRVRGALARSRDEPEGGGGEEAASEWEGEEPDGEEARRSRARELLGLGPGAGPAELRRAWRRVSKECHPDAGGASEEALRRFREAREAYELLSAETLRSRPG